MANAAIYCRSSKDRSDVSLDAQREELHRLAAARDLQIVTTFEDAVYSGSTDERPAFQNLIMAIKDRGRGWSTILVYDTSRIARNIVIAQVFKRECERYAIRIIYATTPTDLDPITSVLFNAMYEAFDQMHSMTSRKKGLAGMKQNIAKGWRAGGRAPLGYRLVHEATGAIRDGRPVMKSKLALSEDADTVSSYLQARAACEPRSAVVRRMGISWSATTLVHVEWNALVYAGHTVWNRHREKTTRGTGQSKRRPREDWVVQRDTHPALISDLQAETILTRLTTSKVGDSIRNARAHSSHFALSGLLVTSDGRAWVGAGLRYRLKPTTTSRGRYVGCKEIEAAVFEQVRRDAGNDVFIERLVQATRKWYPEHDPGQDLDKEAQRLDREADRAAKLALETTEPAPFISLMESKRQQAAAVRRQAEAARQDNVVMRATRSVNHVTVRETIAAEQSDAALVRSLVEKIVLDPDLSCRIDYFPAIGNSPLMASPGRRDDVILASPVAIRRAGSGSG